MKTDWFNVLSEIRNIPIDENLAYELEVFFKDFVFLRKQNNTIILKCLKNDNDYELKYDKESLIIKYDLDDRNNKKIITGKLDIYGRNNNKYVDTNSIDVSDTVIFKSLITIKNISKNNSLTEIIKRRTFYKGRTTAKYKRVFKDVFKETNSNDFDFKTRVTYEKCILENNLDTKYIIPDIIVGSEVSRNKYDTFLRGLRVIQGFNCHDDYVKADTSCPVLLLADDAALNYFKMQIEHDDNDINIYKKKRKIGF